MKSFLLFVLFIILCGFSSSKKSVGILFFNNCEPSIHNRLAGDIKKFYNCDVTIYSSLPLPKNSYYSPRNRYRADIILTYLKGIKPVGSNLIAFTNKDISTTKNGVYDWGIFGLGSLVDGVCVTSTHRLKGNYNRILNTTLHEIGHTYGLRHCPNKRCLMKDAEGHASPYDSLTPWMCDLCKHKLDLL